MSSLRKVPLPLCTSRLSSNARTHTTSPLSTSTRRNFIDLLLSSGVARVVLIVGHARAGREGGGGGAGGGGGGGGRENFREPCISFCCNFKKKLCYYYHISFVTTVNLHQHINSSVSFPLGSKSVKNVEALFPRHMHACRTRVLHEI